MLVDIIGLEFICILIMTQPIISHYIDHQTVRQKTRKAHFPDVIRRMGLSPFVFKHLIRPDQNGINSLFARL